MYSVRMVFTVTAWCFDCILLYVSSVMFRGSRLTAVSCMRAGTNREIEISSVDWAQLSRLLSEDGDRIQSPKRCF
jgi:hypothetical protein